MLTMDILPSIIHSLTPNTLRSNSRRISTQTFYDYTLADYLYHALPPRASSTDPSLHLFLWPRLNPELYLSHSSQQRNIVAWRPVVVDVLEGFREFPLEGFEKHLQRFYPLAIDLLSKEMGSEVRLA